MTLATSRLFVFWVFLTDFFFFVNVCEVLLGQSTQKMNRLQE